MQPKIYGRGFWAVAEEIKIYTTSNFALLDLGALKKIKIGDIVPVLN